MKDKASDLKGKPSLGGTTDHRMRLYSLAAAAASVSALALAQPAEAEIIITNKTIPIHAGTPVTLDLNGDGIADFQFYLRTYFFHNTSNNYLYGYNLTAGGAVIGQGGLLSAMARGAKIGPGGPFLGSKVEHFVEVSHMCTTLCSGGTRAGYTFDQQLDGNWAGGHPNRFVGVKFKINGKIHFGWVRLTVTVKQKGTGTGPKGSFSATITEYGYESVANKSCGAGLSGASAAVNLDEKPSSGPSLGMLAAGADGLQVWRAGD
jgi:hypothetical protein